MKYTIWVAALLALSLGACVSRTVEKETVVTPPAKTVVVPGPEGPPGPPGPPGKPGDTTVIIPAR